MIASGTSPVTGEAVGGTVWNGGLMLSDGRALVGAGVTVGGAASVGAAARRVQRRRHRSRPGRVAPETSAASARRLPRADAGAAAALAAIAGQSAVS